MTSNSLHSSGVFAGILAAFGLAVYVLVVALVEEMGLPDPVTFYVVVIGALAAAAAFGLSAPTMRLPEYFVAGRVVGPFFAGLATAAGLAFLAFFGVSGLDFTADGDGTVLILGPSAAVVIAGLLVAPALRRSAALTLPEYLDRYFGGPVLRPITLVVLVATAFPLLAAAIVGFGHLAAYFVELSYGTAVLVAVVAILATTILGGARSLMRAQSVQFLILFVAYLLPALLLAARETGIPAPAFLVGQTLHALGAEIAAPGAATPETVRTTAESLRYAALVVWLALGLAALPQTLMPAMTLRDAGLTRRSTAWAFGACVLLFVVAPGYALFGGSVDIGVFALPEITGMPFFMVALLVAGGLAAMTVAAAALALILSAALSHDLYHRYLEPRAPQGRQLLVARLLLIVIAALAASVAVQWPDRAMPLASLSLSFAAAGLLPVLVAAASWPRANAAGAAAGITIGFLAALAFVVSARFYGTDLSSGLGLAGWANPEMAAGFFGFPLGIVALVAISLLTGRQRAEVTTAPAAAYDGEADEDEPGAMDEMTEEPAETAATVREAVTPALHRLRQSFIRSRLIRR